MGFTIGLCVFLLVVVGGVAMLASIVQRATQNTNKAWAGAAGELGLEYRPAGFVSPRTILGGKDDAWVEVTAVEGKGAHTTFKVTPRTPVPSTLAVRAEGAWTNLGKIFTGEDVLLNDPDFDRQVNIHGTEEEIVALMDHETRQEVMKLVSVGGTISGGTISLQRSGVITERAALVRLASQLASLGRHLNRGRIPALLLENAQKDPLPEVRARNLEVLAGRFGDSPEAKQAGQLALHDASPRVRMLGAVLDRRDAGLTALQALIQDAAVPGDVRVTSLENLVAIYPYGQAKAAVSRALKSSDVGLRRAAVAAVGRAKDADRALEIAALASETDAALCEAVATTLGQLGDAHAESALIKLLGREEPAVRIAAAKALGLVGTVHAVEPLLPLTRGLLGEGELRAAAQDAVRRIQSLLGDAEAGRVSVAKVEDVAGAVSLASDGGELSLPPDKERES